MLARPRSFRGLSALDAQDLAEAEGIELELHVGSPAGRGYLKPARLNAMLDGDGRVCKTWVA